MAMNPDPTAVIGRRIGAVAIDGVIVAVPWFIGQVSSVSRSEKDSSAAASDFCDAYTDAHDETGVCFNVGKEVWYSDGDTAVTPEVFLLLVPFLLFVVLQGFTGWTFGKLATGIRVVQEDGRAPGLGRALVRWLLWIVDGPLTLYLVGLITSLTTTGHRRVGDMAAKTYVVRADAAGHPVAIPGPGGLGFTAPPGGPAYNAGMPVPTAKPGPQWDERRGTYIQWDPEAAQWMQWDDTAKRWEPIPARAVIPPPPVDTPPPPPTTPPPPPPA